ncbi:retrovirus-related pol polyprotein from transposon TNT 1-94 [Tanacetum coccineum]
MSLKWIALNENEQIITQPTKGPSGNNTKVSVSINESLVPDVPQSHISNQAFTSSYPVPQDRWSKDQHIKLVNIIGDPGEGMLAKSKAPNSQEEGIDYDETFAPVTRMKAISIFLAFDTYMNFKVYQIDVKSAFINGKLKEEVYVKQPPSFESNEFLDYVCKLDKALYGLKQAPKACAKKQQSVAMSSAKAEYVVAVGYCARITSLKEILNYTSSPLNIVTPPNGA